MLLVRWFSTADAEALQEDGVRDYGALEFAQRAAYRNPSHY